MVKKKLMKNQPFKDKVVIICGGSKGIGKSMAREIIQLGGSLCLIARNLKILKETSIDLQKLINNNSQFIEIISCDTTNINLLKMLLTSFIEKYGVPDYLINAVGYAKPNYLQNYTLEDFKENMFTNYYGQLNPILILLPYFITEKKGHIINISSVMGYFGMMGYAAYSPTKFAIVGLTEALRHELKPLNINFSIIYPADTDTPGFVEENKTKPKECAIISEIGNLNNADEVAEKYIDAILKNKFNILVGMAKVGWKLKRYFPKLFLKYYDKLYERAINVVENSDSVYNKL